MKVSISNQLLTLRLIVAVIIVSTQDGTNLSATCRVEVCEPTILISSITLDSSTIKGKIGETYQLVANIKPDDATEKYVLWSSDNSAVASADLSGVITLHSKGNAIIKASATDGSGVSATCAVVVDEDSGITDIEIDPDTNMKIYNLHGILVNEGEYAHSTLTPGTYIIITQGNSIKRVIR